MKLDMSKLGSKELKELSQIVKEERERRGKKNPANHDAPVWTIPNEALLSAKGATTTSATG